MLCVSDFGGVFVFGMLAFVKQNDEDCFPDFCNSSVNLGVEQDLRY